MSQLTFYFDPTSEIHARQVTSLRALKPEGMRSMVDCGDATDERDVSTCKWAREQAEPCFCDDSQQRCACTFVSTDQDVAALRGKLAEESARRGSPHP